MILYILIVSAISTQSVVACWSGQSALSTEDMENADLIFIGKAIFYKNSVTGPPSEYVTTKVTFEITEILSGTYDENRIEAIFINGTFGEPDSLNEFRDVYGTKSRVGVILPETYLSWCKPVSSYKAGVRSVVMSCTGDFIGGSVYKPPHLPYIMNKFCTNSFIFAVK